MNRQIGDFSVEIRVQFSSGRVYGGSGYVVSPGRIVTALHVLIGADAIAEGAIVQNPVRIEVRTQGDFFAAFPEAVDSSLDRALQAVQEKAKGDFLWRPAEILWPPVSAPVPRHDLAVLVVEEKDALSHVRAPLPLRCTYPTGSPTCSGTGFPKWTEEEVSNGYLLQNPSTITAMLIDGPRRFGGQRPLNVTSGTPPSKEQWAGFSGAALFISNSRDLIGFVTQARATNAHAGLALTCLCDVAESKEFEAFWEAAQLPRPTTRLAAVDVDIDQRWRVATLDRFRPFIPRPEYARRLLEQLKDRGRSLTFVTGFGGQGKTEFVLRWLHDEKQSAFLAEFEGIAYISVEVGKEFSLVVDEIFVWLGIGRYDVYQAAGESHHELVIAALRSHRLLIVIDNFERMLDVIDDKSSNVKDLIAFDVLNKLAVEKCQSKLIILSRSAPTNILLTSGYEPIEIGGLDLSQAQELFKSYGVMGLEKSIRDLIVSLEFHPLALSLAAKWLRRANKKELSPAATDETHDRFQFLKSLDDIFRRYEEILPNAAIDLCTVIAQTRQPCTIEFLTHVLVFASGRFRNDGALDQSLEFIALSLSQLLRLGLVRREKKRLIIHSVVRRYFRNRLDSWPRNKIVGLQRAFAAAFCAEAQKSRLAQGNNPVINAAGFRPYIEQVYHLCRAGERGRKSSFNEALRVIRSDIDGWGSYNLTGGLAAWPTREDLLAGFFKERDFKLGLQDGVGPTSRSLILNEAGQCQMHQGFYENAAALFQRKIEMDEGARRIGYAAVGYRNLSDLFLHRGDLRNATQAMQKSLEHAEEEKTLEHLVSAYFGLGFLLSIQGQASADATFERAMEHEAALIDRKGVEWITARGLREVRYAEHLLMNGDVDRAAEFIGGQAGVLRSERRNADLALALRIQGDCFTQQGIEAEWIFEEALSLARRCEEPFILVDCELGWCRSLIRQEKLDSIPPILELAQARSEKFDFQIHLINCRIVRAMVAATARDRDQWRFLMDECSTWAGEIGYAWVGPTISIWGADLNC